jgi:hypothetical protein
MVEFISDRISHMTLRSMVWYCSGCACTNWRYVTLRRAAFTTN